MTNCNICKKKNLKFIFREKILKKYECNYYECQSCKFIQTEKPYWINEAYKKSINNSDTGLMYRNLYFRDLTFIILILIYGIKKVKYSSFLDFGGGYGIFVRLMRDIGIDFYWSDAYSENLLSSGFEDTGKEYKGLVAFEVFEHLIDPIATFKKLLDKSPVIIFSTDLCPSQINNFKKWDYFGFSHGQHISFFREETLDFIAKDLNLFLSTDKKSIHILSKYKIDKNLIKIAKIIYKTKLFSIIKFLFSSKTYSDYKKLTR